MALTFDWTNQSAYFGGSAGLSSLPRRAKASSDPKFTLGVLRNHPVETTTRLVERFSRYLGVAVKAVVGEYDDSFAFGALLASSDALLVWPDWSRVPDSSILGVLKNVKALETPTNRVLVVGPQVFGTRTQKDLPIAANLNSLNLAVYPRLPSADPTIRNNGVETLAGSDIPFEQHMLFARDIAIGWIGSLLTPPLKLLLVDLDNTLYSGVLGEDGPHRICFGHDHLELLRVIEDLRVQGVLICIVTRNDARDLKDLNAVWPKDGFLLKDAAVIKASWEDKGDVIAGIISDLQTVPEAAVFIDDNPGELDNAVHKNPGLWPVLAESPAEAVRLLGLQRHRLATSYDTTAGARALDAQALEARSRIVERAESMQDLHARLETSISTWVATERERDRIVDLFLRTNQFNLALRRSDGPEVEKAIRDASRDIVLASVRDRLADSGIVAAMAIRRTGDALIVDELAISCRVLGRDLETAIISSMVSVVSEGRGTLHFSAVSGPRNEPARRWLESFSPVGDLAKAHVEISDLSAASRHILDAVVVTSNATERQK